MALRSTLFIGLSGLFLACVLPASSKASASHTNQSTTVATPGPNRIETGEWHTVITYTSVTGLPPAIAQSMMATPHPVEGCSPDGDINAEVADAISANGNMTCSEDHGSAANGVITGVATCHDDSGNSGHLSINGTFTSTHVDVKGILTAQTEIGPVTEHMHWVSDHTGAACMDNGDDD